jgi:hypothetical protein
MGAIAFGAFACAPDGPVIRDSDPSVTTDGTVPQNGEAGCETKSLEAQDPAKLPKCACEDGGEARCVPKSKIPASFASKLEGCDDGAGLCVPDKLVKSGGQAPKTCESIVGDGRCMSLCVPDVAAKKNVLNRGKKNECDANELCVPCINPLEGNKPTGVCDIGKKKTCDQGTGSTPSSAGGGGGGEACPYNGPPIDVAMFEKCGEGGRCVPTEAVSEAQRSRLSPCAKGLCAPEKSVAKKGLHLPATCQSVGGAEGRCLSKVIKDIAAKASTLPQANCDANEVCAPCFSPIDGSDTGACSSIPCDKPKEAKKTFASCCEGKGKCVPEASVTDPSQKEKLEPKECQPGAELCAPAEDVGRTTKRPSCTGTMRLLKKPYVGACISKCLNIGAKAIFIEQGTCDSEHTCAPCVDPFGKNTGACD